MDDELDGVRNMEIWGAGRRKKWRRSRRRRETPVARHPTENNQTEFTLRIRNAWSVVKALTQNVGMEFPQHF